MATTKKRTSLYLYPDVAEYIRRSAAVHSTTQTHEFDQAVRLYAALNNPEHAKRLLGTSGADLFARFKEFLADHPEIELPKSFR